MADSSKDIQLRELKDMINDLKKMIKTLQATVDAANKREEALTRERDNLKEEIDLLRKKLFGTSSEKRTLDIPGQLNFFNEAELEQDPEAAKAEDLETILPEKTAKKRKARAMIEFTEIRIQLHIFQEIIHPPHIPLQGKSQSIILCLACDLRPSSGFLCYHYCSVISSKNDGIQMFEKLDGF